MEPTERLKAGMAYQCDHLKHSPFLLLSGELRNMIYRDVLAPYFLLYDFHGPCLFRSQPAITRVNRQIRAEALSIYYAETRFVLDLHLALDHVRSPNPSSDAPVMIGTELLSIISFWKPSFMGYVDICQIMESVASAQRRIPGYQSLLRHVRNLSVYIFLKTSDGFTSAIFEMRDGAKMRYDANSAPFTSEEWYDVNWTDLDSTRAFVKAWMEKGSLSLNSSRPLLPNQEDRLINVLRFLGMHLSGPKELDSKV